VRWETWEAGVRTSKVPNGETDKGGCKGTEDQGEGPSGPVNGDKRNVR